MLTSGVKYNVEVRDGDRWTVYTDAPAKGAAIQQAQKLLSTGQFDGAKVTEDRGQSQEILVWQEEGKRAAKALSIVPSRKPISAVLWTIFISWIRVWPSAGCCASTWTNRF